jgi:hypothetical protein
MSWSVIERSGRTAFIDFDELRNRPVPRKLSSGPLSHATLKIKRSQMKAVKKLFAVTLFAMLMFGASAAFTQDTTSTDDRELNLRAYTELLRADVKAKRVAIITQIMQFSDADAATFWPLFRDYDHELSKLGDTRIQLISDYIKNYDDISNEKANELMTGAFAMEAQRAELKKKHFDIMSKALSARTAARFFQVENQMQHVVDLQISANLPALQ